MVKGPIQSFVGFSEFIGRGHTLPLESHSNMNSLVFNGMGASRKGSINYRVRK